MLAKEEYRISYNKGQKIVLCERLDMLSGMDEELLEGTLFAYKCPAEKESAYNWKEMFENFSRRSFTMTSSNCRNRKRSVFMGRLGCVHRRNYRRFRKAPYSKRDFGCPFLLKISVRIPEARRSMTPTRGGYNLRVYSNRQAHNHSLELALKYRRVGPAARATLTELFNQYHTPDSAMEVLKMRLFARLGDDYLAEASDRAVLPDKCSVTRLYYETYRERYGDMTRKQVRRLQEDAARKRRWLSAREGGERTVAPGANTAARPTPPRCSKKDERTGDDFMDAFDGPADLPGVGWMGTQISFGQPPASAVAGPSADCTAGGGSSTVAAAERTVAQPPQDVIICYADTEETDAASATLVELAERVPLPSAGKTRDVVGDALVAAAGAEGNVAATAAAGIGGVLSSPAAELLAPVGGTGPVSAAARDGVLPAAGEPVAAAVGPGVPSVEQLSNQLAKWASGLHRQLAADGDGHWRAAAASFLESWELLPAPGRLKALGQFGRVTGLSRPADSPKVPAGRRTETAATQTDAEGPKPDAESLGPSPFFRSLCVLRSEDDIASISLRRAPRVASALERRGPIFIRGVRE